MGLDLNGTRFLLYAKKLGVDFEQTAMIGRQSLDLTSAELKNSLQVFGHSVDKKLVDDIFSKSKGYAESLLEHIGAKIIHSFDFSSYEGATYLYDMNQELPAEFTERYSTVLDGGSLEHVFNFPVAIKNCMEMLQIGGHYLGITPGNNFMGHGFYQFSPEIYFSIFTPQNGFELINLIAFEDKPGAKWYSVKNPREIKGRVLLVNNQPVYLLVLAKKLKRTTIFDLIPQQSDYLTVWDQDKTISDPSQPDSAQNMKLALLRNWAKRNLPYVLRHLLQSSIRGYGFNRRFFLRMDPTKAERLSQQS